MGVDLLVVTTAAVLVIILVTVALVGRSRKRNARFAKLLSEHGWTRMKDGESILVQPDVGDWVVLSTRSFATQQSPPTTHVVVSTWSSAWPSLASGGILAGPTPPGPLRELAIGLLESVDGPARGWLGLTRVAGGARLMPVRSADPRLLVLASDGREIPRLAKVADAVTKWCECYDGERDQPAVTIDPDGVKVRIRTDALRAPEVLVAFVDLGIACRAALGEPSR